MDGTSQSEWKPPSICFPPTAAGPLVPLLGPFPAVPSSSPNPLVYLGIRGRTRRGCPRGTRTRRFSHHRRGCGKHVNELAGRGQGGTCGHAPRSEDRCGPASPFLPLGLRARGLPGTCRSGVGGGGTPDRTWPGHLALGSRLRTESRISHPAQSYRNRSHLPEQSWQDLFPCPRAC